MPSVRTLLAALVPAAARVAAVPGSTTPPPLRPDEAPLVASAVEKRRREFALGRYCARTALRELGWNQPSILVGPNREPLWPEGIVGSITDCDGLCAAAVAPAEQLSGLGVDAEVADSIDDALVPHIATTSEQAWLAERTREVRAVLFSAKESLFKCLFPSWRLLLEFSDLEVALLSDGTFTGRCSRGDASHVAGCWAIADGFALTAAFSRIE